MWPSEMSASAAAAAVTTAAPAATSTATAAQNNSYTSGSWSSSDSGGNGTQDRRHPGVKAMTFDPRHQNLTVVYEDHSLYIWRRQEIRRDEDFQFQKR